MYNTIVLKVKYQLHVNILDEAKKEFQFINAAYELLSDPQERAWYDKHRDAILLGGLWPKYCIVYNVYYNWIKFSFFFLILVAKGAEYQTSAVNIYEYFTSACYSGFGEDDQSFYSVYR